MQQLFSDGAIAIRPPRPTDSVELFAAVCESIEAIGEWLPWSDAQYRFADAEAWIALSQQCWHDLTEYHFVVVEAAKLNILGVIGINQINRVHRIGNLGYWVRVGEWGKGVATRAVRLAAEFGFNEGGLGRLEIIAHVNNMRSRCVAEKVGARLEGIARKRLFAFGRWDDAAVYSLVRDDIF
ncbi:MAG TPA: GNAT family protein [Burkholderiales bacterium]|nr:GNAT family protein [Burkholderiales bacterium]